MVASIVEKTTEFVTIQFTVPLSGSLLETEETIQSMLNEAGTLASGEALKQFDTDGSPIVVNEQTWTSKGALPKTYQTPYGTVEILRHVYQSSSGGATYCPLEVDARMIVTSTPRFAKQISHKYAEMSSVRLVADLRENHGRIVQRSFVQTLAETVGTVALLNAEAWQYETPPLDVEIATVSIGMDGTGMLLCEESGRQAMVGTMSLYDRLGERQHTTYIAAAPEHGRATFLDRMEREVQQVKRLYPNAHYQGLADGAPENWAFLTPRTDTQVIDFFQVTQSLSQVAKAVHPRSELYQKAWLDEHCHRLKHEVGYATRLLTEFKILEPQRVSEAIRQGLQDTITYFNNHHHQMHYAEAIVAHLPIGSGVTEAACKVIIKARMCGAGMQWKERGAGIVLSLRTLSYTPGRWQQFWSHINQRGFILPEELH